MASRGLEGSREIEAAKKRLAASKARAAASRKMNESAIAVNKSAKVMAQEAKRKLAAAKKHDEAAQNHEKNTLESLKLAQRQMLISDNEVEEAEKFLKEAEKRWEVIDVDDDDDCEVIESNNKKRKVSVSPDEGDNDHDESIAANNANNIGVTNAANSSAGLPTNNSVSNSNYPDAISPNGHYYRWGFSWNMMGDYKKLGQVHDGVPMYYYKGSWAGARADLVIYRREYRKSKFWCVGIAGGQVLYKTVDSVNEGLPKEQARWTTVGVGTRLAPALSG